MNPSGHPTSPFGSIEIGTVLAAATTLITATASLIGLISTVILSWRRDVREARQAALQQQLTGLQIEKERAALKGSSRKK
ncbi:MAG: hypothetical protein HZY76_13860 [Anaerolineae bacterium]|nr:MAG: hypothetical protein HZY76_13860 [Anaerolineae bacterium]